MALAPGTRLGPYEVTAPLGAGGMGEVYRAKDTRLGREVALKLLPEAFAADPERLARFEREARTLASLNHPHIAQIHGLEDASGTPALVMELVEGPTLADRIAEGALPLDEALPIARQIAEALEAAHDQGIVHRDLKPANVKVRPDGTVKVLDFGLAKAVAGDSGVVAASDAPANSPTITSPAMTMRGVILGTAAYMSPEQAKGKPVDRRADIWAFGCVLFEMLTGRRAFEGEDVSDTLASVLRAEPAWSALPATVPERVRTLVRRCLQRDVQKRLPHIGVARLELAEDITAEVASATVGSSSGLPWRAQVTWAAVAIGLSLLVGVAARRTVPTPVALPTVQFEVRPPEGHTFPGANGVPRFSLSPDGTQVVFAAGNPGEFDQLFIRRLDSVDAEPIKGTESPASGGDRVQQPFFSPDGLWVAYFSGIESALKRVPAAGGPAEVLAKLNTQNCMGSWHDDRILLSSAATQGIHWIPADGGALTAVTRLDESKGEAAHLYPQFLPDGRRFIFTVRTRDGAFAVYGASLDGGPPTRITPSSGMGRFVAPDQLLYLKGNTLVRQRIDPATFTLQNAAITVAEGVLVAANGRVGLSSSDDGTLAYVSGSDNQGSLVVQRRDRSGRQTDSTPVVELVTAPWLRLSPDGRRLAYVGGGGGVWDIWVADVTRRTASRLTSSPETEANPVWSPDGRRVIFRRQMSNGLPAILERDAAGLSPERAIAQGTVETQFYPEAWSPDGSTIVFRRTVGGGASVDLMTLPVNPGSEPTTYLADGFRNRQAAFSPDGRWLAYASDQSTISQVYVRSFPDPTSAKVQVSVDGGIAPRWRRDGRELYYIDVRNRLMAVAIDTRADVTVGTAVPLFQFPEVVNIPGSNVFGTPFDVTADGQTFYVAAPGSDQSATRLTVTLNWASTLAP